MAHSTTIKLKPDTKRMLTKLGNKEDTYDDIVRRVVIFYIRKNRVKL